MPFPHYPRVVFKHNPLDQVICQLRFPPILKIDAEPPALFQESIRTAFPLYERRIEPVVGLPVDANQIFQGIPSVNSQVIHDFSSEDGNRTLALASNFIALTTRKYEQWEDFERDFEQPFDALIGIYKPAFFQRIGLRYVNIIHRSLIGISPEQPWSTLLQPFIAGMSGKDDIENSVMEQSTTVIIKLDAEEGRVRSQYGLAHHKETNETVFVIDNDFFTEARTGVENVFTILTTFHLRGGSLFNWCITSELRDYLEPRNLPE